jgi:hypothetical protein
MVSGVVSLTPRPLYPGKLSPLPTGYEDGWAPEPVWTLWRREKSLVPGGNWTPAGQSRIPSLDRVSYPVSDSEIGSRLFMKQNSKNHGFRKQAKLQRSWSSTQINADNLKNTYKVRISRGGGGGVVHIWKTKFMSFGQTVRTRVSRICRVN